MRAVIQRVSHAQVDVGGKTVGACGKGYMILLGVAQGDTSEDAALLAAKIVKLRVFEDEAGKMNLSLLDVGGEVLVISQFTLLADYRKGNRPDFFGAASPDTARALYEEFIALLQAQLSHVAHGEFGADMQVSLCNDGPVTIVMESDVLKKKK
ncbi:MAG: D-tyrosyl-tRNA(Tyr) deacylase [Clostridia bacterium]|nr:D-tyrosyl-tRNA(Tyr) deacylase [Clostridia bacterium]